MDSEIFKSDHLPTTIQKTLQVFKENSQLTDFVISIGDEEFRVHKVLLAAISKYFEAMFRHDTSEYRQGKAIIQNIEPSSMRTILDWFYTSILNLNIDNVQEVVNAASILQIEDVLNLCVKFIKNRLDPTNCLGALATAERFSLRDLINYALDYCLDMFDVIVQESEFLDIEETLLEKIISHNQLNTNDEELVFNSILKWISKDIEKRSASLPSLVSHVRFSLITPDQLIRLARSDVIRQSKECRNIVDDAKDHLLLETTKGCMPEYLVGPRFNPREPLRRQRRIYVIGGCTNDHIPNQTAEKYNPYENKWVEMEPMQRPRLGVGVTILGHYLYAVGGFDGCHHMTNVERYDLQTNTWLTDVADLPSPRTSIGVVSLDGYIYAIGGQGVRNYPSNDVERYDPSANRWDPCRPLNDKRHGAGVAVLDKSIYVVGGADDKNTPLDSVEKYNSELNRWHSLKPMNEARKHFGCLAFKGKIFVVGGRGENGELDSAECYDPQSNTWTMMPPMKEKRSGLGFVELDGLLYAIGGLNGDSRLNLVEAFDPTNRIWLRRNPMLVERLGAGMAVYPKLSHW